MTSRPRCPTCGGLLRPWTEAVHAPKHQQTYIPVADWRYQGNGRVVARRYDNVLVRPDGTERFISDTEINPDAWDYKPDGERQGRRERRLSTVYVWDGESYASTSKPFCQPDCAVTFARAAYRAGYRLTPARAPEKAQEGV